MKIALRLLIALTVAALLFAAPWWTLVAAPAGSGGPWFWTGTALWVGLTLLLPVTMILGHGPAQSDAAVLVGDTLLGVAWILFTWSIAGAVVGGVLSLAGVADTAAAVAVAVAALTAALVAWAMYEARRLPRVRTVEVPITGLGAALDGVRVVVVTDTHFAATDRERWSRRVVELVNAQHPDIACHAGDLADGPFERRKAQVDPLAGVQAPLGKFYITGNHEYFGDALAWIEHMRALGWQPLRNEHRVLTRGDDQLVLAGIDDPTGIALPGHGPDLPAALAGAPKAPVVLLAHQPKQIVEAVAGNVDLQISGHTHGGQIWPFHYLVRLDQPVVAGLSRHGHNTQLYTSRGTGFWGPPLRLFAPSEVSVLVLRAA
ncbi:metallophosphoesterase [Nocardia thailandica]|uniref:metallophosphoesterase n=1 Tax=Nocardia thailandica TaxID=257275 RepID=UPI00030C3F2C|nr:metallophosphoesterase [Nocardia thailandica]